MSSSGSPTAELLEDVVRGLLDDRGARVVVLVDAVPEAHQPDAVLLVLDLVDERRRRRRRCAWMLLEHLEHRLVGAAVQRAEQGVDAGRDRGEQVGVRRADEAHRRGRAVLLVVGVQDEQQVERLGQRPGRPRSGSAGTPKVIRRKFSTKLERVVGVEERLADRLLVARRPRSSAAWRAGGSSRSRPAPGRTGRGSPGRRSTARRPPTTAPASGARRAGSRRRTGAGPRAASCAADAALEVGELGRRRQLAVDQQVRRLEEASTARRAARSGSRGSAGCPRRRRCR